jgi:hypothetical protein
MLMGVGHGIDSCVFNYGLQAQISQRPAIHLTIVHFEGNRHDQLLLELEARTNNFHQARRFVNYTRNNFCNLQFKYRLAIRTEVRSYSEDQPKKIFLIAHYL